MTTPITNSCNENGYFVAPERGYSDAIHEEVNGHAIESQAISVPANLNPKNATSCLKAQSPRADRNRDHVPDSRPHMASGRSNSIDWKWVASRRHSTASIHLRILQPAASSTTRYGTG